MALQASQLWQAFYSSRMGYPTVWFVAYALTLVLASTIFLYKTPLPEEKLTLSSVEFAAVDVEHPDDIPADIWSTTRLPDDWRKRETKTVNIWYQGKIELNVPPNRLWAILIPALKMNAAVFLNGELLGSGGRFSDPVARNWMTPLMFSIPNGLLRPGDNTIHVRVKSDPPGSGQLSELTFGPYEDLLQAYDTHYLFRITSIQIITTMLLITGGLIALLWLVRREETYYGYYALAVIIWGIHNFNIFVVDIPINTRLWDWFTYITIGYYSFISVIFIHRFLGVSHPRIEISIVTSGLLASFILFFLNDELFYFFIFNAWYPAIFAIGFYVLAYACMEAWKRRSTELQFLSVTGGTTLLYAVHDLMVMHGHASWEEGYYIQYAAAVLLAVFSIILLRRFTHSLNEVEILNRNLEQRVEQKRELLEANYHKLRQLENERVLAEERDRLTRDIHDGMGGNLVSTLAMIEAGQASMPDISAALKGSLDDLRLMIDSMDMAEDDLATMLGMFRMRIAPRLKNSQMALEWNIEDTPPIPGFGPREALQILRILQEAITNTIKHAQASKIRLSAYPCQLENGAFVVKVEVCDNGIGIKKSYQEGHGLKNMQCRALNIGATLQIDSGPSGTRVKLELPVAPTRSA